MGMTIKVLYRGMSQIVLDNPKPLYYAVHTVSTHCMNVAHVLFNDNQCY